MAISWTRLLATCPFFQFNLGSIVLGLFCLGELLFSFVFGGLVLCLNLRFFCLFGNLFGVASSIFGVQSRRVVGDFAFSDFGRSSCFGGSSSARQRSGSVVEHPRFSLTGAAAVVDTGPVVVVVVVVVLAVAVVALAVATATALVLARTTDKELTCQT